MPGQRVSRFILRDIITNPYFHIMKKIMLLAAVAVALSTVFSTAYADKSSVKRQREEIKEQHKLLNDKSSKDAKKEAKRYEKEGWKTLPGGLTLEKQLDRSMMMATQYDDEGFEKYYLGTGTGVGGTLDGAKMQAEALARQGIATQMETRVAAMIDGYIANHPDEDNPVTTGKVTNAIKQFANQTITRLIPVVTVYRDNTKGKGKEVMVTVACNAASVQKRLNATVVQKLEQSGDSLSAELAKKLDW